MRDYRLFIRAVKNSATSTFYESFSIVKIKRENILLSGGYICLRTMNQKVLLNDHTSVLLSNSSSVGEAESPKPFHNTVVHPSPQQISPYGILLRSAEMYQDCMKSIAIPANRGSVIPCSSWTGLASSLKKLYGQPLHYLTNVQLKKWDQMRACSDNEHQPLDAIMHPVKAEALIWLIEENHRLTTSHHYLAKLWISDNDRYASLDSVFL